MRNEAPPLYGLVLTGGKSSRLQRDKALLDFHGKSQVEYLFKLMGPFCEKVFISCRKEQGEDGGRKGLPQLHDIFFEMGPTGGILTAFSTHPNSAWLVVACDLPFVNKQILTELVSRRNPLKMATAFKAHSGEFPEPVCAIYEPAMRAALTKFVNDGHNCPRKALINSEISLLTLPGDRDPLFNVNTPDDLRRIGGVKVSIHYFAILREEAQCSNETVSTLARTVAELYRELQSRHGFTLQAETLRGAVNDEFVTFDYRLKENDAVVFIPPVSGG